MRPAARVAELRRRKRREEKPLAVMFPISPRFRVSAEVPAEAEALLTSPAAPIVLLLRRPGAPLAAGIAIGNPWVGALLPYAPTAGATLAAFGRPVVRHKRQPVRGAALHRQSRGAAPPRRHRRRVPGPQSPDCPSGGRFRRPPCGLRNDRLRRARGYAPAPLLLPSRIGGCWLCVGAQMKNTLAVASGDRVVVSPTSATSTPSRAKRSAHGRRPRSAAGIGFHRRRLRPASRLRVHRYAEATGLPLVAVQHHLPTSCLPPGGIANCADDVLGVSWGRHGLWRGWHDLGRGVYPAAGATPPLRFARLRPFRLAGGEAAIPRRPAHGCWASSMPPKPASARPAPKVPAETLSK